MNPFIASHLKDMNRKTVYQLFAAVGEVSKAEIGRQTGISAPTVIKITDFFLRSGLVSEAGEGDSIMGRKPQLLRFNPEAAYSIGIEFDGVHLRAGIVDLLGNVKHVKLMPAEADFGSFISTRLHECAGTVVSEAGLSMDKILGIGISIPGAVDADQFTVLYAPLIGITDQRSYAAEVRVLHRQLGIPIFFENDVNASAVGEFISRGLGSGDDLLYISLGTGLGAGIILDGKLRKGRKHSAGEIGYMVFDKDFVTRKSEAGWLESGIIHDPDSIADHLALCIANMSAMLDTELVVLGGSGVEKIGPRLLSQVNERLSRLCLNHVNCHLSQGKYPGIIGTAAITNDAVLGTLLEG